MRYIAAAALLSKAQKVLSVIEDAENKIELHKESLLLNSKTFANWRDELKALPFGRQPIEPIKHQLAITKAAHARLCAYYGRILSRLIDLQ